MLSLVCAWIYGLVNNRDAVDLRRHRAHYDVIVMNRTLVPEPDGYVELVDYKMFKLRSHYLLS